MFYSPAYLRRKGRFGLVWLAATQSRVLNKRELYAVNIRIICSNILEHVPGYLSLDGEQRPRRFSLYLSSQLMYGTIKVYQKQWEYLLTDCTLLMRKFHPDWSSTHDIDLIIVKPEPVTLESRVPIGMKDKFYDPLFGLFKEPTVDIEALLETWDTYYVAKYKPERSWPPASIHPEIGSPHSVSDPREIQIRDQDIVYLSPMLPGEQDLPMLDGDNLALLNQVEDVTISPQEMLSPRITDILSVDEATLTQDLDHLMTQLPPFEATPGVHTGREIPGTPQKPKRKRRHGLPDGKKVKHTDGETGEAADETSTDVLVPHKDIDYNLMGTDRHVLSPVMPSHHGRDWLQKNPPLLLAPVTPSPSSVRRRRPHKLVIDEKIQITREEMKSNMHTHSTTSVPIMLPAVSSCDWLKEPVIKGLKGPSLSKLWQRNCVFGLRAYDTETESSDSFQSPLPTRGRKRKAEGDLEEDKTPAIWPISERSAVSSIELGRDISAQSVSLEGEMSRSLVAPASDESLGNISGKKGQMSVLSDHETSRHEEVSPLRELEQVDLGALPTLLEEQELTISPIPLPPATEPGLVQTETEESPTVAEDESPKAQILRVVKEDLRSSDDWTTFKTICPPTSFNRFQAGCMFNALCGQVGKGNLHVRQDEPFSDIFIWLSADRHVVKKK